jgi:hypothetical protein
MLKIHFVCTPNVVLKKCSTPGFLIPGAPQKDAFFDWCTANNFTGTKAEDLQISGVSAAALDQSSHI